MDKILINKIREALTDDGWGDIDSMWFEYIDLSADDLNDFDEYHIEFQKLLQAIEI